MERFEFVLVAKKVTLQAIKRAELCAALGQTTFNLLRDLVAPATIGETNYEEIIEVLLNFHNRKTPIRPDLSLTRETDYKESLSRLSTAS